MADEKDYQLKSYSWYADPPPLSAHWTNPWVLIPASATTNSSPIARMRIRRHCPPTGRTRGS